MVLSFVEHPSKDRVKTDTMLPKVLAFLCLFLLLVWVGYVRYAKGIESLLYHMLCNSVLSCFLSFHSSVSMAVVFFEYFLMNCPLSLICNLSPPAESDLLPSGGHSSLLLDRHHAREVQDRPHLHRYQPVARGIEINQHS